MQNVQISESFRRFGVSETSKHILAIKVGGNFTHIEEHLTENVKGTRVPFTDSQIAQIQDESRLHKVYKIETASRAEAEAFVVGSMALKGT